MMTRSSTYRLALLVLVFLLLAACQPAVLSTGRVDPGTAPSNRAAPTAVAVPSVSAPTAPATVTALPGPAGLGPGELVTAYYTWYLAYSGGEGASNPLVDGAYRDTGYVTKRLADRISGATGEQGGFDPFLCAQDVPEFVIAGAPVTTDSGAQVEVRTSFPGHRFTVRLVRLHGVWQIDDVVCSPASRAVPAPAEHTAIPVVEPAREAALPTGATAATPAGWQVYRNETFGFRLAYPGGWVVREEAAVDGEPPIAPESLKLVVMFMPEAWAQQLDKAGGPDPDAPVLAPYTLEVSVAGEKDFWSAYAPQSEQKQVALKGAKALHTVEAVSDAIKIPRYVYHRDSASELWVVLTDPINGFPDRAAEYAEVGSKIEEIANTFAWLK